VKSTSEIAQLDSLAFLYDHLGQLPHWLRGLTYGRLVDIAKLMTGWHSASGGQGIVPIEEVEQREIIRALTLCRGDVIKAARALKMGKTTIHKEGKAAGQFDCKSAIDPPGICTGTGSGKDFEIACS
jgi:regulatory Fis family protein